ncbi:MAG: HAMP domain-containing protein [Candidatus Omnitrophica bacterium]|nr:HAMP domain-containing protein [Candidatus Omnitrophota bacterium]
MKIKIQHKITTIFIIISGFILLGLFIYLSNNLKDYTYKRIKTNVKKQLELVKTYIEDVPITNITSYVLDPIADKIGHDLDLRTTFIALDGTVFGDSEFDLDELSKVENHLYRPEVQQAMQSGIGQSRRFSTTVKKDFLYTAVLFKKNNSQGIVRLSIPLSEIDELLNNLTLTLEIALLAAFLLAGLVSYLASIFISRPIKEISWAAKDIAQGNFARKILIYSNDEIGDLANAFNYMSEQIETKIEEVSQSKSRLEAVFLSMFEGVMIVDTEGAVLLMNQALKNVLKVKENPIGKKPIEVIRNLQIQEIVENVLEPESALIAKEISTLLPEEKVLLVHATRIEKDKQTEGAVLVFHDVTALRGLEKIRQEFVANVSHELRTPISSIKGFAETLLSGAMEDQENARDFLKIILADSDRLACLIDDLLNLSKIESGKLIMEKKSCKIAEIVEKVIASLKVQLKDKSIIAKINIPVNIPNVLADETRIKQVLLNLVENAIKYNIPDGEIIISAQEIGSFIKVDIMDTGIGIPNKDLPRLFERFYRVDKARSRELGGTGLGLSIVKHIIQSHGGEVFVESVERKGSTFSFTIPRA